MAIDGHRSERAGRATIRDIARAAGVSVATVSRVINGRPDVSPQTRDAVLRVARDHNFTTNRSARALSVGRTGLIGFTVPWVDQNYFTAILSGAAEALYEQEQRVVLCPTHHEHDREVSLLERLMNGATDGAIVLLPEESSDELRRLQDYGYPFVVADPRQPLDEGIPAVSAGHSAGAKRGDRPSAPLGHRRIAPDHRLAGLDRDRGAPRGIQGRARGGRRAVRARARRRGPLRRETGYAAARAAAGAPRAPTAIFASNDNMAVGRAAGRAEPGAPYPRGPVDRRLRRHRARANRAPAADDRPPAARRARPDRGEPAEPPDRRAAHRGPARRARRRS